jgi:hypothetical protein
MPEGFGRFERGEASGKDDWERQPPETAPKQDGHRCTLQSRTTTSLRFWGILAIDHPVYIGAPEADRDVAEVSTPPCKPPHWPPRHGQQFLSGADRLPEGEHAGK